MNSFTDIFYQRFKPTHATSMHWLKTPHQILKSQCEGWGGGGVGGYLPLCSQHLWKTLPQPSSLFGIFFWNSFNCCATKIVIWLSGWNSPVHWTIPEKLQTGWVVDILFWNPPSGIFRFFTLPLEIPVKTSFHPWKFCKIVCHPLEIPRSKTKTQENLTLVFLFKTPINSTSF